MKYYFQAALLLFTTTTFAQKYTAKTVFELLNIDSVGCEFTHANGYLIEAKTDESVGYGLERKTILINDISEYEGRIAMHFKNNKNTKTPFTKVGELYEEGYGKVSIMRRGNHYKLVDVKGRVLLSDTFYYLDRYDLKGFNAYKKGRKSFYYNYKGKLIFNQQFDYVQTELNGYYVIANNGKYGVADKSGKLLLPAIYSSASVFKTNGKLFFSVNEGNLYYIMEQGKNEKLFPGSYSNGPYVVKDRYWLIDGSLFDMQSRKKLFCNIHQNIRVFDKEKGLFYILDNSTRVSTVFDADGKIAFSEAIIWEGDVNNNTGIYRTVMYDTAGKNKTPVKKNRYGLLNKNRLTWQVPPVFTDLKNIDGSLVVFADDKGKYGLMDTLGKEIIAAGKFRNFQNSGVPGLILCIGDSVCLFMLNSCQGLFR